MPVNADTQLLLNGLNCPEEVQQECLLNRILRPNLECEYGKKFQFSRIESIADFQNQVPIVTYAHLQPYIDRMANGENGVLVSEPVRRFFATSGSTSTPKKIPVTSSFIAEKSRAFGIYWELLFQAHPETEHGKVVGNFSDNAGSTRLPGGFPLSSEGAFWSAVSSATQKRGRSPLPRSIGQIADTDSRYYAAARILLEEDVSLLMALNPSTLLLLFRKMNAFAEDLIKDVENGGLNNSIEVAPEVRDYICSRYSGNPPRADQLRSLSKGPALPLPAKDVWPMLKLVVSWRSPMQKSYLRLLDEHLGAIPQRDYLLMASEGVIAIPLEDFTSGGVLATPFHFYEFILEEDSGNPNPRIFLAHELEIGKKYVTILSTSAGLYRYNIGDVVRVTGMRERTPIVEFCYRTGSTCSITGEKITEEQVVAAMEAAASTLGLHIEDFTLHPSSEGFPHYVLLVEANAAPKPEALEALPRALDAELSERNIEYRAKRVSERLGPPEVLLAKPGAYRARREQRIAAGANDAQIKPVHLSRDDRFSATFEVIARFTSR